MINYKGPDGQEDMPYLLTPGPVTTSRGVKFAMLADWGASHAEFTALLQNMQASLKNIAGCDDSYECVLIAGSEFVGIEATLGTFTPSKRKKTLVVANGASALHASHMMQRMGRHMTLLESQETAPIDSDDVAAALDADRNITHVWVVHSESSSGFINPISDIASVVKARGKILLVDAYATFGGIPIDMVATHIDVLVAGPHMCLESAPGVSFVIAKRDLLLASKAESHSASLDLFEHWQAFETTGRMNATPPTHVLAALRESLRELQAEGGVKARAQRYRNLAESFNTRLRALGFSVLKAASDAAPLVHTILAPADPLFDFDRFAAKLLSRGFAIAPGALKSKGSFRVATIGQIDEKLVLELISSIESAMAELDVRSFAPAKD
jgi:2-aminoethylphosphonate-pyruvate transaminase